MLRKVAVGLAALAAMGLAGQAMAAPLVNPWAGDGGEVDVNIQVGEIGEVYSVKGTLQDRNSHAPVDLIVTNAGGTIPPAGRFEDTIKSLANVNYDISVAINGTDDIPEYTRFHVVISPTNRGAYDCVQPNPAWCLIGQTGVTAASIVTWDRGATGGTTYSGNAPGTAYLAFSGLAGPSALETEVDYAADAIHALPPLNAELIEVIWSIASNP